MPKQAERALSRANTIRPSARNWRRVVAAITSSALVAGAFVAGAALPAQAATGQVTGIVYQDYSGNGIYDTGNAASTGIANDTAVAGVTATAYDASGAVVGTANSAATVSTSPRRNFVITLNAGVPAGAPLRIEFTNLPAGSRDSFAGTDNGTSVQFTTAGSDGVDLGVLSVDEYNPGDPSIATAIQSAGIPTNSTAGNQPAVVANKWSVAQNVSGGTASFTNRTTFAKFSDVGAVWGLAYANGADDLFIAATYKRMAGLKENAQGVPLLGQIYLAQDILTDAGATQAPASLGPWLDVTTLGVDLGQSLIQTNAARGLGAPATPARDVSGFALAAKVGIGGMAVDQARGILYFVNLYDKKVYAVNIAAKTLLGSWATPATTNQQPYALTLHNGVLYVGYNDTGSTAFQSAATAQMSYYVAKATVGAAGVSGSFTNALTGSLGYQKGNPIYNWAGQGDDVADAHPQVTRWNTWTDAWKSGGSAVGFNTNWGYTQVYPQPVLSTLTIDSAGFMTVGFQDRTSIQGGNRNWSADTNESQNNYYETVSGGEMLLAAPNTDGTFTQETAGAATGTAGTRTGQSGRDQQPSTGEGPGGNEFYYDRQDVGTGANHREASLGAVVSAPGVAQVASTLMDPLSPVRVVGLAWFTSAAGTASGNGNNVKGFQHTQDDADTQASATFQKGGGLGAVALLTQAAPVEIGNRVWFDGDQDGIQDADEPNVQNVTVQLWAADQNGAPTGGSPVATTTTTADGEYYFRSDTDEFDPTGAYVVIFVKPTTGTATLTGPNSSTFGTISWTDVAFTKKTAGDKVTIDSNADPTNGRAPVTIGGPGQNDHTIDAGLIANAKFTVQKLIDKAGGTAAEGEQFTISIAARDFRGTAFSTNPSSVTLAAGATSAAITVPVGAQVKLDESAPASVKSFTIDPAGYQAITGSGSTFAFRVTNTLYKPGTFTVTKKVTGDFAGELTAEGALKDVVITVGYSYPGGSGTLTLNKANGWSATSPAIPYGTSVALEETAVTGAPPSLEWGAATWSKNPVVIGDGTDSAVTLTNATTELSNRFSVTKFIAGDATGRVPSDFAFTIEYSTDGSTWTALAPVTPAAPTATSAESLPLGTKVFVRELTPSSLVGVTWDDFVWGPGVTPATDSSPAYFILDDAEGEPFGVSLTNYTEPNNGQFSLQKIVSGTAAPLADGLTYTVQYSYPGQDPSPASVTLTAGAAPFVSAPLPEGTVVTITETGLPGLPAGAAWGTPTLTIDGAPAANGATITIGTDTVVAVEVVNPITSTPTVKITKGDGDAATSTIVHEADTVTDGEVYEPGETRDIVIVVENTGPEPLVEVDLTDQTLAGSDITDLTWTFPDGSSASAALTDGIWTAKWAATFGEKPTTWKVGDKIYGHATLTLETGTGAHQDEATVDAKGAYSAKPVTDDNPYNAFTADIQVIKYDGNKPDPAVTDAGGDWITPAKPLADVAQDANTTSEAVKYPVDTPQKVRWVITNTGDTWLTNLTLSDTTLAGPQIGADWTADLSPIGGPADYSFVEDGPWPGLFEPGASFFAEGTLTLPASTEHADRVDIVGTVVVPATDEGGQPTDQPATDGDTPVIATDDDGKPVTVDDDDPFHAITGVGPIVEITKGDGNAQTGTITHEADTVADGEGYQPGETRQIVIRAQNTGDEPLVNVALTDVTTSGGSIQDLQWTLPDGTSASATQGESGEWTFSWNGPWLPDEWIIGTATLTVGVDDAPHQDNVTVDATGQFSGKPVTDENGYNAFTGAIQVIKYDGSKADPVVRDGESWVIPAKPLVDPFQDANDADHAVEYPVDTAKKVRWVVTNTGTTWLTDLTLTDATLGGPAIGDDWTADLSPFGGPADYSFAVDGPWAGLLPPGASFFAEGTLTLAPEETHADLVTIVGTVVVPATDPETGQPTDQPAVNDEDQPVRATIPNPENPDERVPFTVDDDDPFHAWTGVGPYVDIEKGDGEGTTITGDADTVLETQYYEPGETRTIVYTVTNTGDEPLREVVLSDDTASGGDIRGLVWTLPDGQEIAATQFDDGQWAATWSATFGEGEATWLPGEVITGTATLTVGLSDQPHMNRARVDATGAFSGKPVRDDDAYYALTSGIQVIKYDGNKPDPAVTDAEGNWITPVKPLADADQDANDTSHSVLYSPNTANKVRWVVTNTGTTWLTHLTLEDVTGNGPAIGATWTADLSAFGGPANYSFVKDGPWEGLLPPGASFFAEGTLALDVGVRHDDTVTVTGNPVLPQVDEDGVPTAEPLVDDGGTPQLVLGADGKPVVLTDDDPFFAHTILPITGAQYGVGALVLALTLLLGGVLVTMMNTRRRRQLS